jgi:tight adherence protein B
VLAKVIRDRATMRRKITAISAEGRLSAFILSVLPFGIFGSIYVTTPGYYLDVMDDPAFTPAAIIIVSLVVLQALILRHLVTFKF